MTEIEFYSRLLGFERILGKFAYSLTRKKEDSEDLVQETFLKALTNQDKYVDNENLQAWTLTIMKNTFINEYRRSSRMKSLNNQPEESYFFNKAKSTGFEDPGSAYSFTEMSKIVDRLDTKFKVVFKMHFNGYKYKEIASALNLNIGTVKSRIFLSRRKLMKELSM